MVQSRCQCQNPHQPIASLHSLRCWRVAKLHQLKGLASKSDRTDVELSHGLSGTKVTLPWIFRAKPGNQRLRGTPKPLYMGKYFPSAQYTREVAFGDTKST